PWFDDGQPILWWSPNPRAVLFPQELHQSRSLKKLLRKQRYQVSSDRDFSAVIHACAAPRDQQSGTWILPAMIQAYEALHEYGGAHSIEVWDGEKLVGGLYGVALGQVFFGESMFSRVSSASRIALVSLVQIATQTGIQLIDCQMHTQHLSSMGAFDMPRAQFISLLRRLIPAENPLAAWPTQAPRFP
ncbi:MAG: leucyl/phenylalanyl-tRNA--protein transferase, partial [gamma proteobacterium symbiont of Bathyaustriella thionipta]|nr:leucyl/phenylalanyl-tRNA--protein transferase [gamma proteobacterium symbiont of Bathyaustriella thionipta]